MAVCILVSGIQAFALNTSAEDSNLEGEVISGSYSNEYALYKEKFSSYPSATGEITLDKSGIISTLGDITFTDKGISFNETEASVTIKFTVGEDAWFEPSISYCALPAGSSSIEMSIMIDGRYPYSQINNFLLHRRWVNATEEFGVDLAGNQLSPEQVEDFVWQSSKIYDSDGFVQEPLCIALSKGEHTLTLSLINEKVEVSAVILTTPTVVPSYDEYKDEQKGTDYAGEPIIIQGEDAAHKNSKFYLPLSNRNDGTLFPSDPYKRVLNYIGGSNWSNFGGSITWEIDAPQDGYYQLGFDFHQTYLQDGSSYRTLLIDGEIPFKEAQAIAYKYKSGWQYMQLSNSEGENMPIYLTKGRHTLTLKVALGEMSEFASELSALTNELGVLYRKIVKITGESPDANRDYNIFSAIPEMEDTLTRISSELTRLIGVSEEIAGTKGNSNSQILSKAILTISQMLDVKYKAHTKLSAFYDNYSSLCSWLYEMQQMALDIDLITLSAPEGDYNGEETSFGKRFVFSVKRLLASFAEDYETEKATDAKDSITLWSNWGRDQLNILINLINNDFAAKYGINVDVRITAASLIQAGLSGNGPDVMINLARTDPINYAMRGILTDLKQFDNYEEVMSRFSAQADVPYRYNGGVYAVPSTESFNMLFIRTDIFEELDLEIPTTWEEFINVSKIISINNMNVGMDSTALYVFMAQNGVPLFSEDLKSTNLMSEGAVTSAGQWLDFYTKYGFPISYDFFNRFRTGLMPMGVANYATYATVRAAAPEINGKWRMVEMPGIPQADGTINNTVVGSGTASVLLDWSTKKDVAWQFLDWWSSEDIQYRFAVNLESVLGVSGRYDTANLNALYRLGWDYKTQSALRNQYSTLQNNPEVPGSYYIARSVNQVFWNVVNLGADPEDMLNKWIPEADDEIKRKTEQYAK